jgi:hypothetical protein
MAEDAKSSRDSHGRWVKGVSGNPKGRPDKYANIDHGEIEKFMNFVLDVPTPDGRKKVMTREAAIQHRLYQSAMKGNVHAQIFLARRFEKIAHGKGDAFARSAALVSRLKEENREPTFVESIGLITARILMGDLPRPKNAFVRTGKHRSRRKPKRKDGGSDPSVES